MDEQIEEIKPLIRSILLALGRRASKLEFLREYFNTEGESFQNILQRFNLSFYQFMKRMPDVCQVLTIGDDVYINRVSTEESSHMDHLTIEKPRKRSVPSFRSAYGSNTFPRRISNMLPPSYVSQHSNPYRFGQQMRLGPNLMRPRPSAPFRFQTTSRLPPPPLMKTVVYKPGTDESSVSFNSTASFPPKRTVNYKEGRPGAPQKVTVSVTRASSLPPLPPMKTVVYKPKETEPPSSMKTVVYKPEESEQTSASINERTPMKTIVYKPIESNTNDVVNGHLPSPQSTLSSSKFLSPTNSWNSRLTRLNLSSDSLDSWKSSRSVTSSVAKCNPSLPTTTSSDSSRTSSAYSVSELKCSESKENKKPKFRPLKVPSSSSALSQKSIAANRTTLDNIEKAKDYIRSDRQLTTLSDNPMISVGFNDNPMKKNSISPGKIRDEIAIARFRNIRPPPSQTYWKERNSSSSSLNCSSSSNSFDATPRHLRVKEQKPEAEPVHIQRPQIKAVNNPMFFKLDIVDLISPTDFSFKFHSDELNGLTDEMNLYYRTGKGSTLVKVVPGSYAALHEGDWRRVTVYDVEGAEALVVLEDLGISANINVTDIRYLEKSFLAPIAMSARGSLFGVKPKSNQTWSPTAINVFQTIMKNPEMFCTIRGQNENNFALSVTYKKETSVANVLILLGHAEADTSAVGAHFNFVPSS